MPCASHAPAALRSTQRPPCGPLHSLPVVKKRLPGEAKEGGEHLLSLDDTSDRQGFPKSLLQNIIRFVFALTVHQG